MARPAVMLRQVSRLVPFEPQSRSDLKLSAELIWSSNGSLELSYGILVTTTPGMPELVLPHGLIDGLQADGKRQDGLWTTTCFEAFLAVPGERSYWEINLATNGDWAIYHFDDYRQGQRDETKIGSAPEIRLRRWHRQLRLDARLQLKPWWPVGLCPELALTAVLDHGPAGLSHWALSHPAEQADFHDRSTFLQP
tara:strand:- start:11241 stop:11825 length:585 start_codon:yes stop_codon:yes gene_type:complete